MSSFLGNRWKDCEVYKFRSIKSLKNKFVVFIPTFNPELLKYIKNLQNNVLTIFQWGLY